MCPITDPHPDHGHNGASGSIPECDQVDSGMSTSPTTAKFSGDFNSSNCSDNSPNTRKAVAFGSTKAFLKQTLGPLLPQKPKNQAPSASPPQKVPTPNRRKQFREELLAQPSLLVLPPMEQTRPARSPRPSSRTTTSQDTEVNRTVVGAAAASEASTVSSARSVPDRRPVERLARVRPQRHLLNVEPSIPEEMASFDEDSLSQDGGALVRPSTTQDEVEREDQMLEQILQVFPDADRRVTCRLIREGQSLRRVISELCLMRQASSARCFPAGAGAAHPPHRHATTTNGNDADATIDNAVASEIEDMVQQIKEAFPDVDVDRSYGMLQENSLNDVMAQLAEESLNDSSLFDVEDQDSKSGDDDDDEHERNVHYLIEAFPNVNSDKIRDLLGRNSLSTVVAQLCSTLSEGRENDELRQSLLDHFRDVENLD